MSDQPVSDELIEQLAISAPRYTSYPTADCFHPRFTEIDYLQAVYAVTKKVSQQVNKQPLAVYIHIPFCQFACFYCACNKISTQDKSQADTYIHHLLTEIERQGALFTRSHEVVQIHFGGGTPTFLSDGQIGVILSAISRHFVVHPDQADWSIEIDPRSISIGRLTTLRRLGFSRVSFGIQDTNKIVQAAIGRKQSKRLITNTVSAARDAGFSAVGFDLIYGLPHQSLQTYRQTLEEIVNWQADYVSFFNYAHLPARFVAQQRMPADKMPNAIMRVRMMENIIQAMTEAGYLHIGLDHFAKPDSRLAQAVSGETLYRNFQGYTAYANIDLLGVGASAISQIGSCYAQNASTLADYNNRIVTQGFATYRGMLLNRDDQIRQRVIQEIMCRYQLRYTDIEFVFGICFTDYFADAIEKLNNLASAGLVTIDEHGFCVTKKGRLFLRHAALAFDHYFGHKESITTHSPAI